MEDRERKRERGGERKRERGGERERERGGERGGSNNKTDYKYKTQDKQFPTHAHTAKTTRQNYNIIRNKDHTPTTPTNDWIHILA